METVLCSPLHALVKKVANSEGTFTFSTNFSKTKNASQCKKMQVQMQNAEKCKLKKIQMQLECKFSASFVHVQIICWLKNEGYVRNVVSFVASDYFFHCASKLDFENFLVKGVYL